MTEQKMYEIITKKADEMKALIPGTKEVIIAVSGEYGCETLVGAKDKGGARGCFLVYCKLSGCIFPCGRSS